MHGQQRKTGGQHAAGRRRLGEHGPCKVMHRAASNRSMGRLQPRPSDSAAAPKMSNRLDHHIDVTAFRLAAALDAYELSVNELTASCRDLELYRRAMEQIAQVRRCCASRADLSVPWVALLISHSQLFELLWRSPSGDPPRQRNCAGAYVCMRAACTRSGNGAARCSRTSGQAGSAGGACRRAGHPRCLHESRLREHHCRWSPRGVSTAPDSADGDLGCPPTPLDRRQSTTHGEHLEGDTPWKAH